ncbi:hypothetical protein [Egicoccus sp. AB-alg6-2]|uniref:hypothetical protein n=1 Tax=Egicoccus sp. AB-alg6-2 TaxID=3242692 RepID=UPI00359CCF5A
MTTIAVLGAGGLTGRLLVAALGERGHDVVVTPSGAPQLPDAELALVASRDPDDRFRWLSACVRAGVHAIDAGTDAGVAARAYDELDLVSRDTGVVIVPGAGSAVGDLVGASAAAAVSGPAEVHVCWAFPDRGGWRRAVAPGLRATAAARLAQPMPVLSEGRRTQERAGEARRLAWFPKPIGPAHAASVPAAEAVSVPRHVPGVRTVRTYLALSAWRAEVLQATANAVRSPRWQAVVGRRWEQGTEPATGADAPRWACVAESRGRDGVGRSWAYGRDVVGVAVEGMLACTDAILAGHCDAGAVPPARIEVPAAMLDRLSVRTRLRWSVARPSSDATTVYGSSHGG